MAIDPYSETAFKEWQIRSRMATTYEQWKSLFQRVDSRMPGFIISNKAESQEEFEARLKTIFRNVMIDRFFVGADKNINFGRMSNKTSHSLLFEAANLWFDHDMNIREAIVTADAHLAAIATDGSMRSLKAKRWYKIRSILVYMETYFTHNGIVDRTR